jgi:branched-subunit amino acid transport protein
MSSIWVVVIVLALATAALRIAAPVLIAGRELPPGAERSLALLTPSLFAALVLTQTFADGRALVVDARGAGLAAACVAVAVRAPVLIVVVAAAIATALARALL